MEGLPQIIFLYWQKSSLSNSSGPSVTTALEFRLETRNVTSFICTTFKKEAALQTASKRVGQCSKLRDSVDAPCFMSYNRRSCRNKQEFVTTLGYDHVEGKLKRWSGDVNGHCTLTVFFDRVGSIIDTLRYLTVAADSDVIHQATSSIQSHEADICERNQRTSWRSTGHPPAAFHRIPTL